MPGSIASSIACTVHRMHGRLPTQDLRFSPDVTLLLPRRVALVRGRPVRLGPTEIRLLALLAAELGQPVRAAAIAAHAEDPRSPGHADPKTVWVWVCRVRRKIERDPAKPELLTVKGIGYRLTMIR